VRSTTRLPDIWTAVEARAFGQSRLTEAGIGQADSTLGQPLGHPHIRDLLAQNSFHGVDEALHGDLGRRARPPSARGKPSLLVRQAIGPG
jgi:hypothetical protein